MPRITKTIFLTEDALIQGLKRKEKYYYEYLYDHYAGALYGAIQGIVRKQEISEEVLNDTFMRIWSKIETYDPEKGKLFTWMVNIARNLSRDKLRSKEAHKEKQTIGMDVSGEIYDYRHTAELPVDAIGVREYLKKLPSEQEFVVEYLYLRGYTQLELSTEFSIPLGTVKTRLSLAMKKLHALIVEN